MNPPPVKGRLMQAPTSTIAIPATPATRRKGQLAEPATKDLAAAALAPPAIALRDVRKDHGQASD